jgi:hypothetical protein
MKMMLADCRVKVTVDVIRGKWKAIIIKALKDRGLGYAELRRIVPEPTRKCSQTTCENWRQTGSYPAQHRQEETAARNIHSPSTAEP